MIPTDQLKRMELIESYINDELSGEALNEVLLEQKNNEIFAKEIEDMKTSNDIVHGFMMHQQELERGVLNTFARIRQREAFHQGKKVAILKYFGVFGMAASIAFLLFLSFSEVYQLEKNEGDLLQKMSIENEIMSKEEKNLQVTYSLATSFLVSGKTDEAIEKFQTLASNPNLNDYFRESSEWALAVCYLKKHKVSDANKYYQKSQNFTHYSVGSMARLKLWWQIQLERCLF